MRAISIFLHVFCRAEKRLTTRTRTCRGRAPETSPDQHTRQIAPLLCGRFLNRLGVLYNKKKSLFSTGKISYCSSLPPATQQLVAMQASSAHTAGPRGNASPGRGVGAAATFLNTAFCVSLISLSRHVYIQFRVSCVVCLSARFSTLRSHSFQKHVQKSHIWGGYFTG